MKIAFLNIYNGKIERGSEVFVKELASKLVKNHKVFVFQSGKNDHCKYKTVQIWGIPFLHRQSSSFLEKLLSGFLFDEIYHLVVLLYTLRCLPYLWQEKFDWIIPVNGRWQVLLIRLFRFLRGGKILISGHAGVGFDDKWNLQLGKPDIFVALTPTALSWAKNIYPQEKLAYIPNGVDIDMFNPRVKPIKLSLGKPIILTVSALLPYKRIELLIEAVSKLGSGSLLVIGDGPLKGKIQKLGNKLLKDRFQLISHVSHKGLTEYYNNAALFSLPSRENEAFGLVYLEAMACNLPVVAPDDENRRALIGEAGFLGDVKDSDIYRDFLKKSLQTDFGNKPREQAEKFSWEEIAEKYEKVFGEY